MSVNGKPLIFSASYQALPWLPRQSRAFASEYAHGSAYGTIDFSMIACQHGLSKIPTLKAWSSSMRFLSFTCLIFILAVGLKAVSAETSYLSCKDDAEKYRLRSDELQRIEAEDQADRPNNSLKSGAQDRDRQRRERVGSIFGEGCLKEPRDFSAAALVFQHGDQPDHFTQTFLWAKRAVELGDSSQKVMMAWGIDRYLLNTGRKQLFGSQYLKNNATDPKSCWCLEQTETLFPDQTRLKFTSQSYRHQLESLKILNACIRCPLAECAENRSPSPAGTVPGFW